MPSKLGRLVCVVWVETEICELPFRKWLVGKSMHVPTLVLLGRLHRGCGGEMTRPTPCAGVGQSVSRAGLRATGHISALLGGVRGTACQRRVWRNTKANNHWTDSLDSLDRPLDTYSAKPSRLCLWSSE